MFNLNCNLLNFNDLLKANIVHNLIASFSTISQYLADISQYILIPIYSYIKFIIMSFDVIHTFSFNALGIKIDAIPGRINVTNSLRIL